MRIEPEIGGVSVSLRGNFNPAIFTPAWFSSCEVLPKNVAENADLQYASNQLVAFSAEWLQLQVTPEVFHAETLQDPNVRVRDFVLRVFRELLPHTPIQAFGINRIVHFRAASAAARDQVGSVLAPVNPWRESATLLELGGHLSGMVSLKMRQSEPEGRPRGGQVNVTVEPSNRLGDGRMGIYVQVNDHYAIDSTAADGRARLLGFLESDFESSIRRADGIVDHVMGLATDSQGATMGPSDHSTASPNSTWNAQSANSNSESESSNSERARFWADEVVSRARARRHVGTVPASPETEAADTLHSPLSSPNGADTHTLEPLPPPLAPPSRRATIHALQEWEGYVVEIGESDFLARLVDLTAGLTHETDEAIISMAEISESDASRLVVGGIFRWVIGYEHSPAGTRKRVSQIVFRDLPRVTDTDLRQGEAWARRAAAILSP